MLEGFLEPRSREKSELCRRRWRSLPESLRTPQQAAGKAHAACGATHGILERCDFACSACYLTPIANRTRKLPFEKVREQLDLLRRSLGPMGKAQITSGEVTLLEPEELGRIVAYAKEIGLDPMVMTNGQRFTDHPDYLQRLVQEYGLGKVAFHVDTTQKGRRGFPRGIGERALDPVRDYFADMIRSTRRRTGRTLHAAQTVTLTPDNIDQIPEILDGAIRNHDAFRILSLQPVAKVGRTRDRGDPSMTLDSVWAKIRSTLGVPLNRNALQFGHPSCNIVCPLFIVTSGDRYRFVETVPEGDTRGAALMAKILESAGGVHPVGADLPRTVGALGSILLRRPGLLGSAFLYAGLRAWRERRSVLSILLRILTLRPVRVRPWSIVVHRFMDREELATPEGRERLDACVFQVPVDGRMVSMCEMNATDLRLKLNQEQLPQERSSSDPPPAASRILR